MDDVRKQVKEVKEVKEVAPDLSARPANWRMAQHEKAEREAKGIVHPNWGDPVPDKPGWFYNTAKSPYAPVLETCHIIYGGRTYYNLNATRVNWAFKELQQFCPGDNYEVNPKQ